MMNKKNWKIMNGRIFLKEYINTQEMYAVCLGGGGFKLCFDMV